MFKAIAINLPKEMILIDNEIQEKYENTFFKSLNKSRIILNEEKPVGEITILEHTDMGLKIKVEINKNEDNFFVDEPLRVYSIVSFILTKFNYE